MEKMKKVRVHIVERLRYSRFVEIKVSDDVTEEDLEDVLEKAEKAANSEAMSRPEDIVYELEERLKTEIVEIPDYSMDSPDESEIEILGFTVMEESE